MYARAVDRRSMQKEKKEKEKVAQKQRESKSTTVHFEVL
jgi:hypothetical protein